MRWKTAAVSLGRGLVLAVLLAIGVPVTPAFAQSGPPNADFDVERRAMLVVDADGQVLEGGRGDTPFSVALAGPDECPGDSARDQYRIDSYMVPVDLDPAEIPFTGTGPMPPAFRAYDDFRMPLYKLDSNPYAAELTAQATEPKGPGAIPPLGAFSFSFYVPTPGMDADYPGGLPSGEYRIGLACTYAGRITNLWETTIEVVARPDEESVAVSWKVTGSQPADLETPSEQSALRPAYLLVAFSIAMAVVAVLLRRSARRSP